MQRHVRLSRVLRLRVVPLNLLLLLGPRQAVLSVGVGRRGWHQQGLLGGRGRRRQMEGSDLLSHQLLLDLVNEHQVIQLKGLTGHAQQTTATVCECHSRPCDYDYVEKQGAAMSPCLICFVAALNSGKDIHTWKQTAIKVRWSLTKVDIPGLAWMEEVARSMDC